MNNELITIIGGLFIGEQLIQIGTTYLPVQEVALATDWYTSKLGAELNYMDVDKVILELANQAIFLVKELPKSRIQRK